MSRRWLVLIFGSVIALAVLGPFIALAADNSRPEARIAAQDAASLSAKQFLEANVDATGAVKGQSSGAFRAHVNALLIAAATADTDRFDAIWTAMQKFASTDGAYGESAGSVASLDDMLTATKAFIVMRDRSGNAKYAATATTLANAVANRYMVQNRADWILAGDATKSAVGAAGLQAPLMERISALDGEDSRWGGQATNARNALAAELKNAKLPADTTPLADAAAGRLGTYGADAQGLPLDLAQSCNRSDVDAGRQIWQTLRSSETVRQAIELSVNGDVINSAPSVKATVATAAAAQMAGETVQASRLLDEADLLAQKQQDQQAWAVIGRIAVSTDWLAHC